MIIFFFLSEIKNIIFIINELINSDISSKHNRSGATTFLLVYSGYKNMINADCGNIQTLNDKPTKNLTPFTETINFE